MTGITKEQKIRRYERKWYIKKISKAELNLILSRSNFFFSEQHPPRRVNSIYFDNIKYSSVKDNLDGINVKQKIRVRWYDTEDYIKNAKIEIKKKNGFQNTKIIKNIGEIDNLIPKKNDDLEKIKNAVNKKLNFNESLKPTAMTNYDREYFISNDNLIRATIDFNMQNSLLLENKDQNIHKNYFHLILELKYDVDLDDHVRKNMNNSFRLSKNSKYVNSFFMNFSYLS
tara:strand:+ start:19 stop:702 length:684 start_codon:yes stop_codon:yes gene_type:complete